MLEACAIALASINAIKRVQRRGKVERNRQDFSVKGTNAGGAPGGPPPRPRGGQVKGEGGFLLSRKRRYISLFVRR